MKLEEIKEKFPSAYEFIIANYESSIEDGRHELNNGIYANIETYTTQYRRERKYEAHRKYIDIQCILDGEEIITVAPIDKCLVSEEYDDNRDITFYENNMIGIDFILRKGECLILNPEDVHMPCVCIGEKKQVRKVVVKVPLS